MDKFIVRKPGYPCPRVTKPKPEEKPKKQATIEELGRVVVVEHILYHKSRLELETQSKDVLIESLEQLEKKIPSRKVMVSTKIGHVVNKLRKHEDPEVASKAKVVYTKWRTFFKEFKDRPQIEVQYDRKGEQMRSSGRKFLADALGLELGHQLAETIEREAVQQCQRRLNNNYRRTVRTLVFVLKHQEAVRKKVLSGELKVEEFVKTNKK